MRSLGDRPRKAPAENNPTPPASSSEEQSEAPATETESFSESVDLT